MKKLVCLSLISISTVMFACNSNGKTDEQIDSINQAHADSLLQDALKDSLPQDNIATDSIEVKDSIAQ